MLVDWIDLLSRSAKARKPLLDAAVTHFLDREDHLMSYGTAALADRLWPHKETHPRAYSALCKHLVRMAPYFPDRYVKQGAAGEDGKRRWQWMGQRYDARDKVREEIANNPAQWE